MQNPHWLDYIGERNAHDHTVVGDLRVCKDVYSPQLANYRDIFVYLPASYSQGERRYPVIYMHDGQNLFDERTSFAGEWCVDETLLVLEREGFAAIIVGIPNMGQQRLDEYSPFKDGRLGGGRGVQYLDFLVHTVKPLIDASFRTRPDRAHTGILGSSMGGLISLYGFFRHERTFGLAGAMSPAFWFGRRALFPFVEESPFVPGRIYLDAGTAEARGRQNLPRSMAWSVYSDAREMHGLLARKGYQDGIELLYIEEQGAPHHESAWARRLPDALRFLLKPPLDS